MILSMIIFRIKVDIFRAVYRLDCSGQLIMKRIKLLLCDILHRQSAKHVSKKFVSASHFFFFLFICVEKDGRENARVTMKWDGY